MTTSSSLNQRIARWWRGMFAVGAGVALALLGSAAPVQAQSGQVEGRVTAAGSGAALAGAQVSIVGTNLGTRTTRDGRFVLLNVPAGRHQVRVVAIGYRIGVVTVTVQPGMTATANAQLSQSVLELDAVVVTGTAGAARVREVGNTISQINVEQDIKDPPASMDQLLQARAVGLTVMQGNGMAGAGAQIRLRGPVSVSQSNQPIIYIDGIRIRSEGYERNGPPADIDFSGRSGNIQASPLNDINPADIERIEVIKGAAASTLYGTEAAAGVIQIFTKKGSRGAPRWNVQIDQGAAWTVPFGTDENPFVNLRPADDVQVENGVLSTVREVDSQGQCRDLVADALAQAQASGGAVTPVDPCSWLRTAHRQKYSGSVAGGFDAFQYFVSASWEDYDNVLPQDNEQKLVTRGNFTFDLSDQLRVDVNTAFTNFEIRNTPAGNNAQGLTLNVYRAERNYRQSSDPLVLDSLLNQDIMTEIDRLITGGTVHFTPVSWFTNRFTIGFDFAQQENRNLRPFGFVSSPEGRLFDEQIQFTTLTADYVGNLDYKLTDNLAATFSFGGQSITEERIRTFAWGRRFAGPGEPTVSNAAEFIARESRLRVINAGFFLQNIFKFRDRLFLTGGVRFDGNSAFGDALGLEAYPKASLSYVISDEQFWPAALGDAKLRAAVGWSGRAPGAFDKVRTWDATSFGGTPAFLPENVGNPDVGPERTREIEFGADVALLNQRLAVEFTWYEQKTTDALFFVRQVPSLGFLLSQRENVGAMRNRGIEATANLTVIDRPSFGLDIGSTAFTVHSKVLDLGGAAPFAAGGGWVEEGFPVMAATGFRAKNPNDLADPDYLCDPNAGDTCASNNEHVFGSQIPSFTWTQSITLRFPRGVQLSARSEYQGGAWINDGSSFNALSRSVLWPTCARAHRIADQSQWTARERMECSPAHTRANGSSGTIRNDFFWFKQDFWKLRDVTLTVPVGFLVRRANSATLSITAQNAIRWINDDLRMFDPEMTGRDNLDEQNRSISEHVPPPAIFTASLRVSF